MANSKKRKKQSAYRFINKETGEHYTIRLSKKSVEDFTNTKTQIKKFSKALKKHAIFTFSKKVK